MRPILTTISLLFLSGIFIALCDAEVDTEAKVIQVVDGATIIVSYGGNSMSCVYIGVLMGAKALKFNKSLVEGKTVRLEFDAQKYDTHGRLLAYVYCGDIFVNAELIRQGYGSIMIISPNTKYAELFLKLESEAREAKRGLWADPITIGDPDQKPAILENQIRLLEKKIDDLTSKIDQLLEIIKKLQSQPLGTPSSVSKPEKKSEKENAAIANSQLSLKVYVTNSGKKYHNPGCRFLSGNYKEITIEEAKRKKFQPCSICFPEKSPD